MTQRPLGSRPAEPDDCPRPERLATYVEGRLHPGERAAIEKHLVGCSRCYEAFRDSAAYYRERVAATAIPWWRRRAIQAAAAAAIIVVAALLGARWFLQSPQPAVVSELNGLVAAVGSSRPVEPRLTGGFDWGPAPSHERAEPGTRRPSPDLTIAAARIEKQVAARRDADSLAAWGVAQLLIGETSSAVATLEEAVALRPEASTAQSDLAAAYLVRGDRANHAEDFAKALEASERALERGRTREALFNRALALERLHLTARARDAWQEFLAVETEAEWIAEARQHLQALERPAAEPKSGSSKEWDRLSGPVLERWATAVLSGDAGARAKAEAEIAATIPKLGSIEDREPHAVLVATLEARDGLLARRTAEGVLALAETWRLYDADQTRAASAAAARARDALARHPLVGWANFFVAVGTYYAGDLDRTRTQLATLAKFADEHAYLWLLARVRWMRGLASRLPDEFASAMEAYLGALAGFETLGEDELAATVHGLIAELLTLVDDTDGAWKHWDAALAYLGERGSPRRRHSTLTGVVFAADRQNLPRVALAVQSTVLDAALEWRRAGALAEAYIQRAALRDSVGAGDGAMADLAEAQRWLDAVTDTGIKALIEPELRIVSAAVWSKVDPRHALEVIDGGIPATAGVFQQNRLELVRARIQRGQGRDDLAERTLARVMDSLARARTHLPTPLKSTFVAAASAVTEELVAIGLSSSPLSGLKYAECGRAPLLREQLGIASKCELANVSVGVPALYYASLPDRLIVWAISAAGQVNAVERPVSRHHLERLVTAHREALDRRDEAAVRSVGGRLYEALIAPASPHLGALNTELLIVPDGALHALPFASLWNEQRGRYFVHEAPFVIAPSLTAAFVASQRARAGIAPASALVVGNPARTRGSIPLLPDLPFAAHEAREIAALYPNAMLLTGRDATRSRVLDGVARAEIVHLAVHGIAQEDEDSSQLVLADGERPSALFGRDLRRLDLSGTRLVVLAACRSATGRLVRGEGPLTLVRPLMEAGVTSVVATLRNVEDRPSRALFYEFHRAVREGASPAAALRRAQLSMLEGAQPEFKSPAAWAGVAVYGGTETY